MYATSRKALEGNHALTTSQKLILLSRVAPFLGFLVIAGVFCRQTFFPIFFFFFFFPQAKTSRSPWNCQIYRLVRMVSCVRTEQPSRGLLFYDVNLLFFLFLQSWAGHPRYLQIRVQYEISSWNHEALAAAALAAARALARLVCLTTVADCWKKSN